jgi:hypothetical protein
MLSQVFCPASWSSAQAVRHAEGELSELQPLKQVEWNELTLERHCELLLCGYCVSHWSWHDSWSRPHSVRHAEDSLLELQLLKHVECAELQSERHVDAAALLVVPVPVPVRPPLLPVLPPLLPVRLPFPLLP